MASGIDNGENCSFKAITLGAGETFVLPPGAILLGATDTSLVTSSCLDQIIPTTELLCYYIRWVRNLDPEGRRTVHPQGSPVPGGLDIPTAVNAWEDDDGAPTITIDKISIGGTIITSGISCVDFGALESAINGSSAGSALLERKYIMTEHIEPLTTAEAAEWGGANQYRTGFLEYQFFFKTLDTVAPTVYLEFGGSENISSLTRLFPVELECADYPTTSDVSC